MRTYLKIGSARLLNIKVILDDTNLIYSGMVEDAPEQIKELKYSKVDVGTNMVYYVYSELN